MRDASRFHTGASFFLIYINDLHVAIKCSEVQNFVDDVNFNSCVKPINKQVNYDLKTLVNWLKANKIVLNIGKTELLLFTSPKKQLDCDLKIKLNGKISLKQIQSNIWEFKLTKNYHGNNRLIMWLSSQIMSMQN